MSYSTLVSRLQQWMVDEETDFTDSIDAIIALAETRISQDLNVDAMRELVTGTFTTGSNTISKAAAIVAVRWFHVTDAGRAYQLELRQDGYIRWKYPLGVLDQGRPSEYAFQDEATIIVGKTPDDDYSYEMMTEQRITGLSSTTETWLSERHDNLLFYACLLESGAFEKDDGEQTRYQGFYDKALVGAQTEVVRGRTSAESLSR